MLRRNKHRTMQSLLLIAPLLASQQVPFVSLHAPDAVASRRLFKRMFAAVHLRGHAMSDAKVDAVGKPHKVSRIK
jgi:hypothetical protein